MKEVRVALLGTGFMGKAHSNAYRSFSLFFPDAPVRPKMTVICGRDPRRLETARSAFGWEEADTNWEKVVAREDIDLVDISATGQMHYPMALAAARNRKVVFCEKPLANTVEEAEEMVAAVEGTGVVNLVCHNYRRTPAVVLARRLIEDGTLGHIHHFRATYLQGWLVDPQFPLVWRVQRAVAGYGSLGDIGSHIVDISHYLVGPIAQVTGLTHTFVERRPLLAEASGGSEPAVEAGSTPTSPEMGEVDVDDAAVWLARFSNGAVGTFEATRFAAGRINFLRFEVNGSKGSVAFNFERMNELELFLRDDPEYARGFRTVYVTEPSHPFGQAIWKPACFIGFENTFLNTVYDLMQAVATGTEVRPSFRDGLYVQKVLAAVEQSARTGEWVQVQ